MSFPKFISVENHEARIFDLKSQIVFLEAEIARSRSREQELTNALAATSRAVLPFSTRDRAKRPTPPVRMNTYLKAKQLEMDRRSDYERGVLPGKPPDFT